MYIILYNGIKVIPRQQKRKQTRSGERSSEWTPHADFIWAKCEMQGWRLGA